MDELTRKRLEHNEEVFRVVNDELDGRAALRKIPRAYLCECADLACDETIALTHAEYRELRARRSHFVVIPGHEVPELERVVERQRSHFVVQKH